MASKPKPTIVEKIYSLELPLPANIVPTLLGMVTDDTLTDSQKVGGMALTLLLKLAEGGLMISAEEIARIREATGMEEPTCGEDLVEVISQSTGISEGKNVFPVTIDPVYMALYEEPAKIQGRETREIIQEIVDSVFDNDALGYLVAGVPRFVRMTEKDYQSVKSILDEDFDTGTKLAEILRAMLESPLAEPQAQELPAPEPDAVTEGAQS